MREMMRRRSLWFWFGPFVIEGAAAALAEIAAYFIMGEASMQYQVEITTVAALLALPILNMMYRKDKKIRNEKKMEEDKQERSGRWLSAKYCLKIVLLGVTACIALNILIMFLGVAQFDNTYQVTSEKMYTSPYWVQAAGLGILIPVKEEVLDRGLLYQRVREICSVRFSVIFTSVLFGLVHGNLVQFLFAAALGILLAYICELSGMVRVTILLHVSVNLTSLIMTWCGGFSWIIKNDLITMIFFVFSAVTAGRIVFEFKKKQIL